MQQARARDYARGAITAFPPCAFGLPSSSYLASACARAVSPWQACSCCHIRRGLALDRLGWIGVAAVVMGCGAPMVLLVNAGLLFAPAAHGGALFPVMPLMVALLAAAILGEAITPRSCWGPSALSGPRAAHLEHTRTLAIFSSCAQDWHGPATQSPCGARKTFASRCGLEGPEGIERR